MATKSVKKSTPTTTKRKQSVFKRLWKQTKNAFHSLKRNTLSTIVSVSTVTVVLFLVGGALAILMNVSKLTNDIANNVTINVYLKSDTSDTDESSKDYHKIYDSIMSVDGVDKITFSSKDDQLNQMKKDMGSAWDVFDGDANPLSDTYIVQVKTPDDVKSAAKAIAKLDGVDTVDYGGSTSNKVFNLSNSVRIGGTIVIIIVIIISILIISNTIRMTIFARNDEIEIMRLVGSQNNYIREPFIIEGALIGFVGAIVPTVILAFVYRSVYLSVNPSLLQSNMSLYGTTNFMVKVAIMLTILGVVIGVIGSLTSMNKYLKA